MTLLAPLPRRPAPPHWLALRPQALPAGAGIGQPSPQLQLAWWALQFSPRVCLLEEAVLLELSTCLRLFGGLRALHERIQREGRAQALLPIEGPAMAWAPNALAALALLRGGRLNGQTRPLAPLLDSLPLACLSAVQAQSAMLARLGCRQLGDVRRLPRAGLARRFGSALLLDLDRAYGELQQAHDWIRLPERFEARLELPWRLDDAQALMPHALDLLRSCCAWLTGHHAGLSSLRLGWQHDAMRARDCPPAGELLLRSAELTRSIEHLEGLLREHLAQLSLPAPVAELRVWVDHIEPLRPPNADLRLDEQARTPAREPLGLLLQRCAVRLGPARVRRPRLLPDARPEAMQAWAPWAAQAPGSRSTPTSAKAARPAGLAATTGRQAETSGTMAWPGPQPSWLVEPPQRLAMSRAGSAQERPIYQGELQLLLGPQRVESGWWGWPGQPLPQSTDTPAPQVQRDYYLARNPQGQLLWIFRARDGLALPTRPEAAPAPALAAAANAAGSATNPASDQAFSPAPTAASAATSAAASTATSASASAPTPTAWPEKRRGTTHGTTHGTTRDARPASPSGDAQGAAHDARPAGASRASGSAARGPVDAEVSASALGPGRPAPATDQAVHWYLHGLFA